MGWQPEHNEPSQGGASPVPTRYEPGEPIRHRVRATLAVALHGVLREATGERNLVSHNSVQDSAISGAL